MRRLSTLLLFSSIVPSYVFAQSNSADESMAQSLYKSLSSDEIKSRLMNEHSFDLKAFSHREGFNFFNSQEHAGFSEDEDRKTELRSDLAKTYARYLVSYGVVGFLKDRYKDSVAYQTIKKAEKYSKVEVEVNQDWRFTAGMSLSRSGLWSQYGTDNFNFWAINKFNKEAPKVGMSYQWESYIAKASYNLDTLIEEPVFLTELSYVFY